MSPWKYRDYRESVEHDVEQGLRELGFNIDQSIGYAHTELSLRLDDFPEENVLALTALAICANQHKALSSYAAGDELFDELALAYANGAHEKIIEHLDEAQKGEFLRDFETVISVLGF